MAKNTDRPKRFTMRASKEFIEILEAAKKLPQNKFNSQSDIVHTLLQNYAKMVLDNRDYGAIIDNII